MSNEQLVHEYQQGNIKLLDVIVERNMGLVYKVANRYTIEQSPSIDIEDLEQEGVIGLIMACNKYEQNKGAAFSSYAFLWIRQRISRFIQQRNTNDETSLDIPMGEDESLTLGDTVVDETDHINDSVLRIELDNAMNKYINDMERKVLKLRYGWDMQEMTVDDVAALCNKTKGVILTQVQSGRSKLYNSPWGREEREHRKQRREASFYRSLVRNI